MLEDDIHEELQNNDYDSVSISLGINDIAVLGKNNSLNRSHTFAKYQNNDNGINCAIEISSLITEFIYYQKTGVDNV